MTAALAGIGEFTVAPGHPALEGHFPGRPVAPGVLLLDEACGLILAAHPGRRLAGLPAVKFVRPVLPGQTVSVLCGPTEGGRLAFACSADGAEVARGTVVLE